jgi:hypothetical protein
LENSSLNHFKLQLEQELPTISIQLARIALEVVSVEAEGISFRDAAERVDYPMMASTFRVA